MPEPIARQASAQMPADAARRIHDALAESAETKRRVAQECTDDILRAARTVTEAMHAGRKLLICGNGGSAADSQHIAAEFVSVLSQTFPRPALPSIALTTDTSMLTASANDFGFDGIFARQVEALGVAGDVLLGITTSGNSANVLAAVASAKQAGMTTIGLSGRDGGRIRQEADQCICVPSDSTQHIQEAHIAIGHILCDLVERSLFERPD